MIPESMKRLLFRVSSIILLLLSIVNVFLPLPLLCITVLPVLSIRQDRDSAKFVNRLLWYDMCQSVSKFIIQDFFLNCEF